MARSGWTAEGITEDFPGLGLVELPSAVDAGAADRVARRMDDVSARITGERAATMQADVVPSAYRTLARQLGLDPDEDGTPLARLMRERIRWGKLPDRGLVGNALALAVLETGVPVFALPITEVGGNLGLMTAIDGEALPGAGEPLPAGTVVVSDLSRPLALALLPSPLLPAARESVVLYALRAPGVSDLVVEEALWVAAGLLQGSPG